MSDKPITLADFKDANACPKETGLFKQHFGDGTLLTYIGVMSVALVFDWTFAARHMLTDKQQKFFKAIVMASFRQIARGNDMNQQKRRRAMATAFYRAYNSPEK